MFNRPLRLLPMSLAAGSLAAMAVAAPAPASAAASPANGARATVVTALSFNSTVFIASNGGSNSFDSTTSWAQDVSWAVSSPWTP